jgi:hypothetical protein
VRRLRSDIQQDISLTVHLALPLATSKKGDNEQYPALYWLNDNILLGIFNCYRVDDERLWNHRLGWCKLSHVCQRWRHLLHECAFHLGMHIECTNGTPIVDTLDHLPPLPLVVYYRTKDMRFCPTILTEQDESGIYHVLQLHDRVRQLDLHLPPFILHKVIMHMDKHFPILEHLSLSFPAQNGITLALPKAFLAPNLRHLALPGISPPRRLQLLTSTVSLVKIELLNIQTSSYFRPRLLVARLRSLPHLEKLSIEFSIPIPLPGTERELLGEEGAPVTLPSLKRLRFQGVSAYLESLITQIRVPLLEQLDIKLFNELAFALPHLCHLLNTTKRFKFPIATVCFCHNKVSVTGTHRSWPFAVLRGEPFSLHVLCSQLDRQINCAAHIFHALLPSLSGVEQFKIFPYNKWPIRTEFDTGGLDTYCELLKSWLGLTFDDSPWEELYRAQISTEFENGAIDGTTWHELLRSFIRLKELYIDGPLLEELSRALQLDEVGSDPGFLPRLRSIHTGGDDNLFTSFINTRQVVGRPVEFMKW